jgi:hypothetical protein
VTVVSPDGAAWAAVGTTRAAAVAATRTADPTTKRAREVLMTVPLDVWFVLTIVFLARFLFVGLISKCR